LHLRLNVMSVVYDLRYHPAINLLYTKFNNSTLFVLFLAFFALFELSFRIADNRGILFKNFLPVRFALCCFTQLSSQFLFWCTHEASFSRVPSCSTSFRIWQILVDREGLEPSTQRCKRHVFPINTNNPLKQVSTVPLLCKLKF
jgi:hypothetical protein